MKIDSISTEPTQRVDTHTHTDAERQRHMAFYKSLGRISSGERAPR